MQPAIVESNTHFLQNNPVGGAIGDWINRLFGCRHKEMSRPISSQGQTYRACLDCGARRQFNLKRWEMQGHFYYRQPAENSFRRLAA